MTLKVTFAVLYLVKHSTNLLQYVYTSQKVHMACLVILTVLSKLKDV